MCETWRRIVSVLIVGCLLAVPSKGLAQALSYAPSLEEDGAVSDGSPAARPAPDAPRRFDSASLARAVKTELRLQAAKRGQGSGATTTRKRDSLRNGVLIGAGVGAVAGGVLAASTGSCDGPDYGGGCGMAATAGAGAAFGAGAMVGALLGAGIGAIVDLLIK